MYIAVLRKGWQKETGHYVVANVGLGLYMIYDTDLFCLRPGQQVESQVQASRCYAYMTNPSNGPKCVLEWVGARRGGGGSCSDGEG